MKRHYNVPQDPIEQIPLVEDRNCYPSYHQSNSCKMTDPEEGFQEEDYPEEEDSQAAVEDSPEEADILEEVQVPQAPDHQAEDGACHLCHYHKATESWWEKHLPSLMETENKHKCSSTNGSCIGVLTTTAQ